MKDLHDLAEEYAKNVIDRSSYRKSRSELIQGICAGEITIKAREYLAPLRISTDDSCDTKKNKILRPSNLKQNTAPASVRPTQYPSSEGNKIKYILISAIIACLCVIVLFVLLPSASSPKKNHIPTADINNQATQSYAGQNLIIDFTQKKNWAKDSLSSFITSWQQLTDTERAAAQKSLEMKRFSNAIYQQLLSERALLSLGDVENAVANQRALINFVEQLGINDEQFTILEPELPLDTEILTEETVH